MKKIIIAILSIIILIAGIVSFLNNRPDDQAPDTSKTPETIDQKIAKLSAEIKSVNGQLIDVREPSEYEESHADAAINIPLGNILKADFSGIDSSRPIYLICRSGNRAEQAKKALEQAGFENIKNIGGLIDWKKQGDKVCSSSVPLCV